jgi:hypothetical protein
MLKRLKLLDDSLCQRFLTTAIDKAAVEPTADRISSVSHLSEDVIETTPAVISSYGKTNKGIATSNAGTWLITFVDETLMRCSEEMAAISLSREEQAETETPKSEFSFCNADFIRIKQGVCENSMVHGNPKIKNKRRPGYQDRLLITSKSPPSTQGIPWTPPRGRPAHLSLSSKDSTFLAVDSICMMQGACKNSMAHGNLFFYLGNLINCQYRATCLSSPSLPLHFNISMGAPQGSPCSL